MKRRLIAAALILAFPFGMAACGAQSKGAACKHIQKAAVSANKSAKNILWFIVCRYIYNVCGVGLGQDDVGAERTFYLTYTFFVLVFVHF